VRQRAKLASPEGTITLNVGTDVALGDRIDTNRRGEVQLVFTDETRLVVGPNSSLVIEAYLLRSKNRANNFTIRALGGTFRMITGKSRKQAYKIQTHTATIGVRGTAFDFSVDDDETSMVLFEGQARLCKNDPRPGEIRCRVLSSACEVARAHKNRSTSILKGKEDRRAEIRENFRYILYQRSLREDFRIRQTGCGDTAARARPITGDKEREPRQQIERERREPPPDDDEYPDGEF